MKFSVSMRFLALCAVVFLLSGCRIRNYMVPMIVGAELDKIETQKAHSVRNVAVIPVEDGTKEVPIRVDFSPIDNYLFSYESPEDASATIFAVSFERFLVYDKELNLAQKIVNLPPFSDDTFTEFRKKALYSSLDYYRADVGSAPDAPDDLWLLKSRPRKDLPWLTTTEAYITKDTMNNIRTVEKGPDGEPLSRFVTVDKTYEVDFEPSHFRVELPTDCRVITIDLSELQKYGGGSKYYGELLPSEHVDQELTRMLERPELRIYDYTQRQMVLFFAEYPNEGEPMLRSPVSRRIPLDGRNVYVNYVGYYSTCRWRCGLWDRLVFTSLSPEIALSLVERIDMEPREAIAQGQEAGETAFANPKTNP